MLTRESPRRPAFDIAILADMTAAADVGVRVATDVRALSAAGLRVALVHGGVRSAARLSPDVRRAVRAGYATAVDSSCEINAVLAIVHFGGGIDCERHARNIAAERGVLVVDRAVDFDVRAVATACGGMRPLVLAPTSPSVRASLIAAAPGTAIEAADWPLAPASFDIRRPVFADAPVTIAYLAGSAPNQWPATREELEEALPTDGSANVIMLGRPPKSRLPRKVPRSWRVFGHGEASLAWVLREADIVVSMPGPEATAIPDAMLVTAMAAGRPCLMPMRLRTRMRECGTFLRRGEVATTVAALVTDAERRSALGQATQDAVRQRYVPEIFVERIEQLMHPPANGRRRKPAARSPRKRTGAATAQRSPSHRPPAALFIASNGVGIGHVARLLAIARRTTGTLAPTFLTLAPCAGIIESFGYRAEYLPSQSYTGAPPVTWDAWFGYEVERTMDAYDARVVVYDGNDMPAGLLRAIVARGDCRLAWVRQGGGDADRLPAVGTARFCDIIIEPGEIAGTPHLLEPARLRRGMVTVDPIRLLDDEEALPRNEAAAALGLDAERPAVLIHLGAGTNRDITPAIEATVRALAGHPDVQIAIAEWANTPADLPLWPEVAVTVKGFPLARYYNAFDFSVGAAGYNAFHEAIAAALPSIFVANTQPGMDDQIGRARFAQDIGAAFELPEDRLFELAGICAVLMSDKARAVIRANCGKLARGNGAAEAARLIGELA